MNTEDFFSADISIHEFSGSVKKKSSLAHSFIQNQLSQKKSKKEVKNQKNDYILI